MLNKILIVGANGFIGSYITAKLLKHNFSIVCAVRDVHATQRKFPLLDIIPCDLNQDTDPEIWMNRLANIDTVINVAGLLTSVGNNKIENVHLHGPKALFDACVKSDVKRIIHISALGIDDEKTTEYALTKKSAETYLKSLNSIDWIILKPSLVYASGCYGGTSLFRALAALPFCIPLVGDGLQQFQPIHMDDLTDIILACVTKKGETHQILKVVGPEKLSMKDILIQFRRWLGLSNAIIVKVPLIFISLGAKLGDLLNIGPLNSTSYKMMMHPNVATLTDQQELIAFTNITPCSFEQGIASEPLTIQSLWHARLFFLKPVIKCILGLFWIASGIIPALLAPNIGLNSLQELGFNNSSAIILLYSSCLVDVVLGAILIIKSKISTICFLQILLILAYTIILTVLKPDLWLEPLGPLLKNIPVILLTLALMAIERDK